VIFAPPLSRLVVTVGFGGFLAPGLTGTTEFDVNVCLTLPRKKKNGKA